jgi:uridine kinase
VIEYILKRDGRIVPFDRSKITFAVLSAAVAVGGKDRSIAEGITDKVVAILETRHAGGDSYPTVEEIQDTVEKVLIEQGHARTAKAYIVYRYEHTLKRVGKESLTYSSDNIPYRKLWEALSWAVDNRCVDLEGIRSYCRGKRYPDLVRRSEEFFAAELGAAFQGIKERQDGVRMIVVAGPSSSGKTTTTRKISEALSASNRRLVPLEVDNYFFDRENHPRDPHGDYDYETPQALDLDLFNTHLKNLMDGRSVEVPFYNFQTGCREGISRTLRLENPDVLLLDCLHGLHPPLTEAVPAEQKFRVYIETLAQLKDDNGRFIRWTDIRMLRRMVRDMQFRNHDPWHTLLHWYLVRRSELRYIVSRLRYADIVINSFFPSELPVLKGRLQHFFPDFVRRLRQDPDRSDALERAERVTALLDAVPAVDTEEDIPMESLLREFLGGGMYHSGEPRK